MGIPVLATDVGGLPEAVDVNGENGGLLALKNGIDIAARHLRTLLVDTPAERQVQRREAAWNRWAERFNATKNHRALAQALHHELD